MLGSVRKPWHFKLRNKIVGDERWICTGFHDDTKASSFLILFNVNLDDVNAVELELGAGVTSAPQKLQISINFAPAVSFFVSPKNMTIKMQIPQKKLVNCLAILGHIPTALRPSEVDNSLDQRRLGVRLCSVKVTSMHDSEDRNHVEALVHKPADSG